MSINKKKTESKKGKKKQKKKKEKEEIPEPGRYAMRSAETLDKALVRMRGRGSTNTTIVGVPVAATACIKII